MAESRPIVEGMTPSVAVVIVAVLAAFVALAAIDSSVAIVLAVFGLLFGGGLIRELTAALEAGDGDEPSATEPEPAADREDALERLRTRYADGELIDAEFERRLEVLLETETVADVERYLEDRDGQSNAHGIDDTDRERERSTG